MTSQKVVDARIKGKTFSAVPLEKPPHLASLPIVLVNLLGDQVGKIPSWPYQRP